MLLFILPLVLDVAEAFVGESAGAATVRKILEVAEAITSAPKTFESILDRFSDEAGLQLLDECNLLPIEAFDCIDNARGTRRQLQLFDRLSFPKCDKCEEFGISIRPLEDPWVLLNLLQGRDIVSFDRQFD